MGSEDNRASAAGTKRGGGNAMCTTAKAMMHHVMSKIEQAENTDVNKSS